MSGSCPRISLLALKRATIFTTFRHNPMYHLLALSIKVVTRPIYGSGFLELRLQALQSGCRSYLIGPLKTPLVSPHLKCMFCVVCVPTRYSNVVNCRFPRLVQMKPIAPFIKAIRSLFNLYLFPNYSRRLIFYSCY